MIAKGRAERPNWNRRVATALTGYGVIVVIAVVAAAVTAEPDRRDDLPYHVLLAGLLLGLAGAHAVGVTAWYAAFRRRTTRVTATVLSCRVTGYSGGYVHIPVHALELAYELRKPGRSSPRRHKVEIDRQYVAREAGDRMEVLVDPGPPSSVWIPTRLPWWQPPKMIIGLVGLLVLAGGLWEIHYEF